MVQGEGRTIGGERSMSLERRLRVRAAATLAEDMGLFPASTWSLTVTCNSSSRRVNDLIWTS